MRRRTIGVVLVVCALASSCGSSGGGGDTGAVIRALTETARGGRSFRFEDATLDSKKRIRVEGKVHDDLRYSGTVVLDGKPLYQAVVSDNSMAIRFLDRELTKPAIDVAQRADPITARALSEGRWVVDHTVAPPFAGSAAETEQEPGGDRPTTGLRRQDLVSDDPFTDGAQVLNYSERAVRTGFRVELFNPDDIEYNALDDPWRADAEVELEDDGIRRYDLRQPPLPPPAERGRTQSLPTLDHFRKMAIYVKGERVIRIREQIAIADRREFRRAETGRNPEFYLRLRDAALAGALQDEFRQRKMSYDVTRTGDTDVTLPRDAEKGILGNVLPALKEIFDFEFIGGGGPPLPGRGGPPLPEIPRGTSSPTATTAPSPTG